ncbi:metallophosphoesterase family protein [Mucilaginibacter auburnensis]|uniref:Calcineurin-like phosphoesterase family protein n=1 Tax=Mucilaginibacter auburnensis TaxID=1457233 RepID=A0A2H9VTK0_9SPHI|nr:metallophosphoesterase [Mucilaginibacter auburnensis]PJJ84153.1 calcineurin-like phosphoesterase family protein [Mucilaginibacter auburnensis]
MIKKSVCLGLIYLLTVCCYFKGFSQQKTPVLAFASDTQEPQWVEKLFLKADHNLEATQALFKDVSERKPSALFIMGDVVSSGKKEKAWKNMDKYIGQSVKDSIPVYATLGNHDVMFNAKQGMLKFKKRFPDYEPTGFSVVIDSVAVLLLNSNFSAMSSADTAKQNEWYKAKLKKLDTDPSIKMIIVGCHHSPYTNSRVVKPSLSVQQNFVAPFITSRKCILFISGHSHNYEQFKMQGKNFVVIGGGGGLHQGVKENNDVMNDVAAGYKPLFHYLEVRRDGTQLNVLSRQMTKDFSAFTDGTTFRVKL